MFCTFKSSKRAKILSSTLIFRTFTLSRQHIYVELIFKDEDLFVEVYCEEMEEPLPTSLSVSQQQTQLNDEGQFHATWY